jgi:hypothetical protein
MVRRWFAHKLQFASAFFSMIQMLQSASASRPLGYGVLTIAFVRASPPRPLLEHDYTPASHLTFVMLVRNSNDWHFTRRCSFSSVRSTAAISRPLWCNVSDQSVPVAKLATFAFTTTSSLCHESPGVVDMTFYGNCFQLRDFKHRWHGVLTIAVGGDAREKLYTYLDALEARMI